jgi:hypothetical protein
MRMRVWPAVRVADRDALVAPLALRTTAVGHTLLPTPRATPAPPGTRHMPPNQLLARASCVVAPAKHHQVLSDVGAELSFQLPMSASGLFPALFATLERDAATLGVETYGISVTTMEEVFMKVCALCRMGYYLGGGTQFLVAAGPHVAV